MRSVLFLGGLLGGCGPSDLGSKEPCDTTFYADADGDGHGDSTMVVVACEPPQGHTSSADDCDDANAAMHPDADELCNGIDDDCDRGIDVAATDAPTWYIDRDADGFGDAAQTLVQCTPPPGYVDTSGDCDEANAAVHPGADEVCNDVDDDCDDLVDVSDPDLTDGIPWYADVDDDDYGDPATLMVACERPPDLVGNGTDCDDADPAIHPTAAEACDGIDNDCDALVDDDDGDGPLYGTTTFHTDADGDGYGADGGATTSGCLPPGGFADNDDDCDDADPAVGAPLVYYEERDHDGYGSGTGTEKCDPPDFGWVLLSGDCDRFDPDIHPGAEEICNREDDNCDGLFDLDDPLITGATWYGDADGDGYGSDADILFQCGAPSGYVGVGGDCDDGDAAVNPVALEYCDAIDNDCTGKADDAVVYVDWYADEDGDGFGDPSNVENDCLQPSGYLSDASDCDDTSDQVHPGSRETCANDVDEDCDGAIDNCRVNTSAAYALVTSSEAATLGDTLGAADMDADGTADLVIGSGQAFDTAGAAFVVYGPVSGDVDVADAVALVGSAEERDQIAKDGLVAADVDLDGVGDVVAFSGDWVRVDASTTGIATYAFLGPVTGDRETADADVIWLAAENRSQDGGTLARFADFDGDGGPDVAVGMPFGGAAAGPGVILITPGETSGGLVDLDAAAVYAYGGYRYNDGVGRSMAPVVDTNGDGLEDLAVLVGHGVSDLGELYVVCGGGTAGSYLASDVAAATFTADDYGDLQSHAVASDDVDQDGAGDLFVSAGTHLFGFLGPLSGAIASSDADVRWDPDVSWGSLGYEGLALGNVDADKLPDVIMTGTNGVYVQTSPASGVIDVTSLPSFAGGTDRYFGHSLAVVPDWNGDDASEIVVGSLDPAGGAYVFDSGTLY